MPPSTVPAPSRLPNLEWEHRPVNNTNDSESHVHPTQEDERTLAALHQTMTGAGESEYAEPHSTLDRYLKHGRPKEESGKPLGRLGVCFKNVTTWAERNDHLPTKTLADALWRTLTFQDVYEWTIKKWVSQPKMEEQRPLIRDFSGVVRSGEILLYVLPSLFGQKDC